jgi:hypothetical protein
MAVSPPPRGRFSAYEVVGPQRYRERLGLVFEEFAVGQRFQHRYHWRILGVFHPPLSKLRIEPLRQSSQQPALRINATKAPPAALRGPFTNRQSILSGDDW